MGLNFLKKKSEAMGKKPVASFLKVNKYENPQMALNLIAHICTATEDLDVSPCFEKVCSKLDEMKKDLQDYGLENPNLLRSCLYEIVDLEDKMLSMLSSTLKIAVAGGYSAGKSSLLNDITGVGDLLPTGIDPVSLVNTYLNCKHSGTNLVIRGENLRNKLVLLNEEVLACIQHSSKSKTYIATVLNKIVIDTPAQQYLDGVTFVDTPGYNNSSNSQESDRNKAVSAMNECEAIFWCIDIEGGTITKDDIDILKQVDDKPIVILYTKMDKKPKGEVKKIVEDTERICLNEFGKEKMPLAVMAVSCREKTSYSTTGLSWQKVIEMIKGKCGETDLLGKCISNIMGLFDREIDASNKAVKELEDERRDAIKYRDDAYENYRIIKETNKDLKKRIADIFYDNYEEIMKAADKRGELCQDLIEGWSESLDREVEWSKKAGFFKNVSSLAGQCEKSIAKFNRLIATDISYNYWDEEYRKSLFGGICETLDENLEKFGEIKDNADENYQNLIKIKKNEEECAKCLRTYERSIHHLLSEAYGECTKLVSAHQAKLQKIEKTQDNDVFSAISGDNYERFLSCFSNGVDLTVCNGEGYSPITWAVRSGNNEMVKFFIDHEVDLSVKDGRGFNSLETAVMQHYQDMCELLMDADNTLLSKSQPLQELADRNDFKKWISKYN